MRGQTRWMPDLGTVIPEYLAVAYGDGHSAAELRSMRRALEQIEAGAGGLDHAALAAMDERSRARLAWQIVDDAGLPPGRLVTIAEALRSLAAYAPEATEPSSSSPRAAPETRTPTFAMVALGAHVSAWVERIIVIAFVLTAIGLALALA